MYGKILSGERDYSKYAFHLTKEERKSTQESGLLTETGGVVVIYTRADSELDSDLPLLKFLF